MTTEIPTAVPEEAVPVAAVPTPAPVAEVATPPVPAPEAVPVASIPAATPTPEPDFFGTAAKDVAQSKEEHAKEAEYDEWNPKTPSQLRGFFMKATRHSTKYGIAYKAYIKDYDTDLTVTVFCARKMLREGILAASPARGSLIVFDYQGQSEGKSGFKFHEYYVRSEKADVEYWAEVTRPKAGETDQATQQQEQKAAASFSPDEAPF